MIIAHSETIANIVLSDTLGCQKAMLTAMVVMNDCVIESQQRRKKERKTCDNYSCLEVCFRAVFNFAVFSVLCADEV